MRRQIHLLVLAAALIALHTTMSPALTTTQAYEEPTESDSTRVSSVAPEIGRMLTLRVDIQNLPMERHYRPSALEAAQQDNEACIGARHRHGNDGSFTVRVDAGCSIQELRGSIKDFLRDHVHLSCLARDNKDHADTDGFDLEVYNAHAGLFQPLSAREQIGSRRARLNLILHAPAPHSGDQEDAIRSSFLALPARLFDVDTQAGGFRIAGNSVYIGEVANSGLGTGLTTWDGSVVLAKYLEHAFMDILPGTRVLELGAGTGLVGLSAALLGASQVFLTDLEYTMRNLADNAARTLQKTPLVDTTKVDTTKVTPVVLDWFHPTTEFGDLDFILASDVVWVEELIPPLVRTMQVLIQHSHAATRILMAHQQRSVLSDELLFRELDQRHLHRRVVPVTELHPEYISDRIHIWEITALPNDAATK